VSETGFAGTFTANDTACSGPMNAHVDASSGAGASEVFTITGGTFPTSPGPPCSITFGDGSQTVTVSVTVT
jgi:hypothetical protein